MMCVVVQYGPIVCNTKVIRCTRIFYQLFWIILLQFCKGEGKRNGWISWRNWTKSFFPLRPAVSFHQLILVWGSLAGLWMLSSLMPTDTSFPWPFPWPFPIHSLIPSCTCCVGRQNTTSHVYYLNLEFPLSLNTFSPKKNSKQDPRMCSLSSTFNVLSAPSSFLKTQNKVWLKWEKRALLSFNGYK